MIYSKVPYEIPKTVSPDEVNPERDRLRSGVGKGKLLLAKKGARLTEELISRLKDRDVRLLWIYRRHYHWIPHEEALRRNKKVIEKKEVDPLGVQILDDFDNINSAEGLSKLLEQAATDELSDMLYTSVTTLRQQIMELEKIENGLFDKLQGLSDDDRQRIIEILSARNPSFDPDDFPDKHNKLIQDFSEFLSDLRETKFEVSEVLLEIDEKNLSALDVEEAAENEVLDKLKEKPQPTTGAVVESPEFALELFSLNQNSARPDFVEEIYVLSYKFVENAILKGHLNFEVLNTVRQKLSVISAQIPGYYWLLAEEKAGHDDLFFRGLNRFFIYSQVWPDKIEEEAEFRRIFIAALFLDIGMVNVPETFWLHNKELADYQALEIHKHPRFSREILAKLSNFPEVENWLRLHHFRGSGEGYPDLSSDQEWTTGAQKMALCDAYEALTSQRPWRRDKTPREALNIIESEFAAADSVTVDNFVNSISGIPPGSLVRCTNGALALVESGKENEEIFLRRIELKESDIRGASEPFSIAEKEFSIKSVPADRIAPWKLRKFCFNH